MICLLHGYSLSGSGSNLWTRSVAEAVCFNGQAIHLMCQEMEPEKLEFVAEAYTYDEEGNADQLFKRDVPYDGRCILHRPQLDLLPVYVHPPRGSTYMKVIPELSEEEIEAYLRRNEAALERIVKEHGVAALHANHVVLMSVVAQRVGNRLGVPYAVMPHGSAIEYVVRKDPRMQKLAAGALSNAGRIFVLGPEIRTRLKEVFSEVPGAEERMHRIPVGANTRQFRLVEREDRPGAIDQLKEAVADLDRGKTPEHTRRLHDRLSDDLTLEQLQQILEENTDYKAKRPDADLEEKLDRVDWTTAHTAAFIGRIIAYKGVPSVIAAFPEILRHRPSARLLVAGRGPLRESMEALVWALATGHRELARNIARWGTALEDQGELKPFATVHTFFEQLDEQGELDDYFSAAEEYLTPGHVIFTGYMDHDALCHLYPCCDVTLIPSIVPEGGPLIVPESMASGSYPIGADHSGLRDNLEIAGRQLPAEDAAFMKLSPEPEQTVRDIIANVPQALDLAGKHRAALREVAIEHFSWSHIAENLVHELTAMAGQA